MEAPEEVEAKEHFTPPTLTAMLIKALHEDVEPESASGAEAWEEDLDTIKSTIKEWLRTASLPWQMSKESTRQLLISLVDEPE